MDRLSYRLLGLVSLVVMLALIGCAKRVELRLDVETTYVGPQIADSINVRLTDSYSLSDYKVNLSCTYTNIGDPGRVNVLTTVAQGDKSWERRESLYAVVGQPVTSKFVFEEPTFDLGRILAPPSTLGSAQSLRRRSLGLPRRRGRERHTRIVSSLSQCRRHEGEARLHSHKCG